jgi:hypothetical protein
MNRLLALSLVALAACADDSLRNLESASNGVEKVPEECVTSLDCGPGTVCDGGYCVAECATPPCNVTPVDPTDPTDPTDPVDPTDPGELPLYVGGQWRTEYHLDWSDYLGPLADLGTPIDTIDQVLQGNIDLPFIDSIIDQYVPDWIGDVVHVLNNIVHFFQDVRIDGRMSLSHTEGQPTQLTGLELWDWGYVTVIDGCAYGENDPDYPDCALVAIPMNSFVADFGSVDVQVLPFAGTINGAEVSFADRQVRVELGQFLMFVINMVIRIATNGQYDTLNEMLAGMVNCPGLESSIEASLGQTLNWITPVCISAVDELVSQLTEALNAVTIDWELMEFDQRATAYDDNADGSADRLGAPPSAPGLIENGDFQVLLGGDMPGTWFGTRP